MSQLNGKATIEIDKIQSHAPDLVAEQVLAKKKTASQNKQKTNRAIPVRLQIDAGARRVKCRLNGEFKDFPSEAKEIGGGQVPLQTSGCFSYKNKPYVVGAAVDRVNGDVILGSQDNKISKLDIWVLGAIAHFPAFLEEAAEKRRYKNLPVQLTLNLQVVTLSSPRRNELAKALNAIGTFTWEDIEFRIDVKECKFLEESEGAALEVVNKHLEEKDKSTHFYVIDLGGGTITSTCYEWNGARLSTLSKSPISGGGTTSIINCVFKALTRVDRGAIQTNSLNIQEALQTSHLKEEGWFVPLVNNGQLINIADEVRAALSEWVQHNYAIRILFDFLMQRIIAGDRVFCSGGGFAIKIVADWIIKYLLNDIRDREIVILDNPQDVNLAGLRWRDENKKGG